MKILLGSNNKHKAQEMQEIFEEALPGKFEIILPIDILAENIDPVEDGDTFEANALIKAREFFEASGLPSFADDTGLEVEALGNAPGVHSARYAGEHGDNAANRKKLLAELEKTGDKDRKARFRTVICYYDGSEPLFVEGICSGRIVHEERGDGGFGYDPVFVPDGYELTFSEMSAEEKNKISHRGAAGRNLINALKKKLSI